MDKVFEIIEKSNYYDVLKNKSMNDKTILFCDSPSIINEDVDNICSYFENNKFNQFINFLEKEYHKDWSVIKLLKKGILIHHGQMPKYIQNKMITLFNNNSNYHLLIGTNSISEGINTPTKNLFIHPNSTRVLGNRLLLKNTIGRAGRLGEYPIGHIFSIKDISNLLNDDIEIKLSISKDDELEEIENSSNESIIEELCSDFDIGIEFYNNLRKSTHFSISTIRKILDILKKSRNYKNVDNLPFMAQSVFKEYYYADIDKICIKGVLQYSFNDENGKIIYLNSYDDRISYYRLKSRKIVSNSSIIDYYMRFIYSSLEHYILPIAKIGLEIYESYPNWKFGENVIESINLFFDRFNRKILGLSNYDQYNDEQKIILQTLREYGIIINNNSINLEMIIEIENRLNIRYSTFDIINAIKYLAKHSKKNKNKFKDLKDKYID